MLVQFEVVNRKTGETCLAYREERVFHFEKDSNGKSVLKKDPFVYYLDPEGKEVLGGPEDYTLKPENPYDLFGAECGKGWYPIIQPIIDYVDNVPKMEIIQIKEKFGELRVYLNFEDETVSKLIDEAVKEASETCELCGSKEDIGITITGWATTMCKKCFECICKPNTKWKEFSSGKVYTK